MKKLFALIFTVTIAIVAVAQPRLVGHRGSYWGVENTAEAFINGAKKGYHYLETDVKVTKDGKFVCWHDDNLTKAEDSPLINANTLETLQSKLLTQTRGGVTYTGYLTTFERYLDICKEYGAKPLIELKWANGINSNDCSNLPALVKIIEEKGFRNDCYIFTSMKPCLQYVKTNYPDMEIMLLVYSSSFDSSLEWCKTNQAHIGPGLGSEITKAGVQKYHEAGLLVNAWSINTAGDYKTYGNYGCDFITTDYLDPETLPTLNQNILFPPNTVDFPVEEGTIQGYYDPEQIISMEGLMFESGRVSKALLRDGLWYVLMNNIVSGTSSKIVVLDAETGECLDELDMTGVSGGEVFINDIAFTADGVLLGCNKTIVPSSGEGDAWKIYKWATIDATPELFAEIKSSENLGNWENAVVGESFTASGKLNDLYVYTTTYSSTVETPVYRIAGMKLTNGVVSTAVYAMNDDEYNSTNWGMEPRLAITPYSRNNVLVDSYKMTPTEFTFDWTQSGVPMANYATAPTSVLSNASEGVAFFRYGTRIYAYAANKDDEGFLSAAIYDVSDSIKNMSIVSSIVPNGLKPEGYYNVGAELVDGEINLYSYIDRSGFTKYSISVKEEEPSSNADFALELLWQNSTTTNNAPEHIDGTNAQQGGAAAGLFYVNDCVDEKVYIFDKTGCLGGIPGGKGWGCALDDAGNIIVRNDKETGSSHSFIIYSAGATVESHGEPVLLDVEVPLSGQTNFISASGDVLGKRGNIYMFPNGKAAINIITMVSGEVVSTKSYEGLSLTGSTAGYVIPVNNNTENWIYQVRSSGYYSYSGGLNNALLAGRSSTTAPSRNNTVGGDYFTLSGHKIFIHASGANYKGGFTMRDMTINEVICSVDPIGTLGYETGGNYSVANWVFAEKIDDGSYYIYQYCPSNGMAVYKFYDKNYTSIDDIISDKVSDIEIYPNPVETTINIKSSVEIQDVGVYSIMGAKMKTDVISLEENAAIVDVSSLPQGIYLLKTNTIPGAKKFLKK
ncbi:MAG: T9SS type A sorting domain-containing protein [Muribaculaceae bacterium]|nr:T9SS type A sorting domain-containing protein [Muribaculaceae bacterium]